MNDTGLEGKVIECEQKNLKLEKLAYVFIIAAATFWGTIGIFTSKLNEFGFTTTQMAFTRAIVAFIFTLIFISIKNPKLLKIKPRDSLYFVGTGIVSFVFMNWCYFTAIKKTSLSVAVILLYTSPAIVNLLSAILFKERMTKKKVISLVLTFAGCIFVTAFGGSTENKITFIGVLAGLGAGLGYGLYSIFGRYALEKYDSMTVTLYTFLFACIGLVPITDIKGMIGLFSNTSAIYYGIGLGVVCAVLPFLLYTKSLEYIETSKAAIIATFEPIVATALGIILFSEPVTVFKILGVASVVFAVAILREKSQSPKE